MSLGFYIAYISPNGSTEKVAHALSNQLSAAGQAVFVADLSDAGACRDLIEKIKGDDRACLLVGSPVYRDVAVPPVMAFIDMLPDTGNGWAVPFVTYGRACSGVALWQMAMALQDKGYGIAGAAKVAAVHSMMWLSSSPPGAGHPDGDDLVQVRKLADDLPAGVADGELKPLDLASLDYQPAALAREFKARIGQPWMIVPKTVDEDACTECGVCVDVCPSAAVALDPMPRFDERCFDCFNCIRLCPEEAISPAVPMEKIAAMIRERVERINELPPTLIF